MPQIKKHHKGFFTSQNLQSFFCILQIRKPEFQSNRVVWKKLSTKLSHRKGAHTQVFLCIPRLVFWANVVLFHYAIPSSTEETKSGWMIGSTCIFPLVLILRSVLIWDFLHFYKFLFGTVIALCTFSHRLLYLLWFRLHCLGLHILRFRYKLSTTIWNRKMGKCPPYNAYFKCTVGSGVKQTGHCAIRLKGHITFLNVMNKTIGNMGHLQYAHNNNFSVLS